jgi:Protein of unknown function (DUF3047)
MSLISTRPRLVAVALFAILLVAAAGVWLTRETPNNPLTSQGGPQVVAMDFAAPISLDPLPPGWTHYKFWTKPAMELSFVTKDAVPALRCATKGGGSIFGRWTDIDLAAYPKLTWRWFVETPIVSALDERTRAGDDHPVRWFVGFADSEGGEHAAEIIWGNTRLKRGDWKVLDGFQHFVADGGPENAGTWRDESADLLAIYRKASGRTDTPRLKRLAIFCDSDETGGRSVAYTGGPVTLSQP